MYFILKDDITYEKTEFYINEPKDIPVELDFMGGKLITMDIDNPFVYTTNAKSGDELRDFNASGFMVMSKRFLELIKGSGVDNLQVFPAIIKSEVDDTVWEEYYGVNVLGSISCADLGKSIYDEVMPGHYIFDQLAIDAEKAKGALLFRLQEHMPTLVMHKSVGKYIVDNDPDETLTGWDFEEIIQ